MFKKVFRVVFTFLGMLFGYGASTLLFDEVEWFAETLGDYRYTIFTPLIVVLFGIIFFDLYQKLVTRGEDVTKNLLLDIEKIPTTEIVTGTLGLIAGMFIAYLISQIINGIEVLKTAYINTIISVVLYILLGYIGLMLGRRGGREFKLVLPNQTARDAALKKKSKLGNCPKIFDTSVIIDGRIVDILKTGFIEGDMIIPDFVLVELRHIADSADDLKRARGRRGLDILAKIQDEYGIDIYDTASDKVLEDIPEVDVKLLKLAQTMKGAVVTNDFNLNKVATVQGLKVLNINELANSLKPVVLPGEMLQVFLVKEGKENDQAVAYLDDGTMIVVEGGKKYIGQNVRATVTSVLQTTAGRMIFAKP